MANSDSALRKTHNCLTYKQQDGAVVAKRKTDMQSFQEENRRMTKGLDVSSPIHAIEILYIPT